MKKKILFVIPEYSHGGTNRCLENLLTYIDKDKYDISIYCLYQDGGEYYKKVFKPYVVKKSLLYYYAHDNVLTRKICGLWHKISKKTNFNWLYKREAVYLQKQYKYDTVIGYQEGAATIFASFFYNCKRIAWFHCPYIEFLTNDLVNQTMLYSNFNIVVCVSETFAIKFKKRIMLPHLNIIGIHNILDADSIIRKAEEIANPYNNNYFNIITVGRFVHQKRFDIIPSIANSIKLTGGNIFKWYIIGEGDNHVKTKTISEIEKYHLEDTVVLLGEKDNPYPYIKNANLMVCTSETENYPTVINEAKLLHVPVVSNNYDSAKEIVDLKCGIVCSYKEMPIVISNLITNNNNQYSILENSIKDYHSENEDIINRIESII